MTADRIIEGTELRAPPRPTSSTTSAGRVTEPTWPVGSTPSPGWSIRTDAYLGALAEHVAGTRGLAAPAWTREPRRFLDHFWWPSRTVGLHARALVESPAAFRRREIFIGRTTLHRV